MKTLSKLSIVFAVIGLLVLGSSYIYSNYIEPLMLTGFVVLFIGLMLSFSAMFKREQGKMKLLAVAAFFLFGFIISWNGPFQILRLLTWIKN
ncbi:hypothetical protein ACFVSW_11870 [Neobacillus sp. NPDC058068]|uniref:hypothetical protein n=1 Tax=Neobacillus sp. NPDC058068 TaxID=3346325 RepID=UPI0036DC912A